MFQEEGSVQTTRRKNQVEKYKSAQRTLIFDNAVIAFSGIELAQCRASFVSHSVHLFLCCVLAWPYSQCLERKEVFVLLAALHWVLQKTSMPAELFYSLGARNKYMPVLPSLRHMALFGIRSLVADVKTAEGLRVWACSTLYILFCAFLVFVMCRWRSSINAKRKFFHFALFLYYAAFPKRIVATQSVCLLFLIQVAPRICLMFEKTHYLSERSLFSEFLSEKDKKSVISHILLLGAFLFVLDGAGEERKRALFVIASVGIVDGVASFFPKAENTHKSKIGAFIGGIVAKYTLDLLGIKYPIWMYTLIGAAEYCAEMNDNILLPVLAYAVSSLSVQ